MTNPTTRLREVRPRNWPMGPFFAFVGIFSASLGMMSTLLVLGVLVAIRVATWKW